MRRSDYRLDELNREREEYDGDPWAEFERRKRVIAARGVSPQEYERLVTELAEEMGL